MLCLGGGRYCVLWNTFSENNVCACVPLCWSCGTPDQAPSLMYVCLQPPPLTHTHSEMRSDSVMNVSAVCPLALHAVLHARVCVCECVCVSYTHSDWAWSWASVCVYMPVCVGEVSVRAWVVTTACCLIGWLEELFTLYLCAQWRGTDPMQTVACTPDSHHTHIHTRTIIPNALASLVTMQTHSCSPTLAASLPGQKYGALNKLTDVGLEGGNWLNKLKYYTDTFT